MAIITISRGSLSGGEELARRLAAALQADCVSREDLVEGCARDFGTDPAEPSEVVDRPPSFWKRLTSKRPTHLKIARAVLLGRARSGNVVYHGHAGHLLLKDVPCVLRVRLIAPMEKRISAAMENLKLTREQAIRHVEQVDDYRVRWTKFLYGVDWHDPSLYDVTINLEKVTMDAAVDMVVALAKSQAFAPDRDCLPQLARLALVAHIQAALEARPQTRGADITITIEDGKVRLAGRLENENLRPWILSVVHGTEGVIEVIDEMQAKRTFDYQT
jgi:cytidylate kinase